MIKAIATLEIDVLKAAYQSLMNYTQELEESSKTSDLSTEFSQCFKGFVHRVVISDDEITIEEVEGVNSLFDTEWDFFDLDVTLNLFSGETILEEPHHASDFLERLDTLEKSLEISSKESKAEEILHLFENTGYYFAHVDGDFDEKEGAIIQAYLDRLNYYFKASRL